MPEQYEITNADELLRRFRLDNPDYHKTVNGVIVPSSFSWKLKKDENGLSVNIKAIRSPENSVVDTAKYGLAGFSASIPLGFGFECAHDPNPPEDPDNDAHALIKGDRNQVSKKMSKAFTDGKDLTIYYNG